MSWVDHLIDAVFSWPIFVLTLLYGATRWVTKLMATPTVNVKGRDFRID